MTWNSAQTLRRFWTTKPPAGVEWIVVDNSSSDDTVAVASELGATRVIAQAQNVGFGAANNAALALAKGNYVAFVNPDVTVEYQDLDGLARLIEESGGLVSPQLLNSDGTLQANGRGLPSLRAKIRHRTKPQTHAEDSYAFYAEPGSRRYVAWLMGAVVAGTRDTVLSLGGWDERFFIYYEDSDLGLRAWRHGLPVVLDGNHRWVHGWARETKSFKIRPWLNELSSMSKFYAKYPELFFSSGESSPRHASALGRLGSEWTGTAAR